MYKSKASSTRKIETKGEKGISPKSSVSAKETSTVKQKLRPEISAEAIATQSKPEETPQAQEVHIVEVNFENDIDSDEPIPKTAQENTSATPAVSKETKVMAGAGLSIKNRFKNKELKTEEDDYNDNIGSEAEADPEKRKIPTNIVAASQRNFKNEMNSNIDGFSQSDILDGGSLREVDNTKRSQENMQDLKSLGQPKPVPAKAEKSKDPHIKAKASKATHKYVDVSSSPKTHSAKAEHVSVTLVNKNPQPVTTKEIAKILAAKNKQMANRDDAAIMAAEGSNSATIREGMMYDTPSDRIGNRHSAYNKSSVTHHNSLRNAQPGFGQNENSRKSVDQLSPKVIVDPKEEYQIDFDRIKQPNQMNVVAGNSVTNYTPLKLHTHKMPSANRKVRILQ